MQEEKHEEILREVRDELDAALNDVRGLVSHQRRLAFALSLGAVNVLELYFHHLNAIKEGAKIDHRWLKKKEETTVEQIGRQLTLPIDAKARAAIMIARKIEEKRDDLAYGAPVPESILQEKINLFFELERVLRLPSQNQKVLK
jgi:hypothetical protein